MVENKDKDVRLNSRDTALGGLLARGIPGGPNMTDCPTMERLSQFIDGKLSREDRESVVTHLSDCGRCYSILSESLAIREELISRSRARIKRYLSYTIPTALAAAAVMLFIFRILQPEYEFDGKMKREPAYRAEVIDKKPLLKPDVAPVHYSFAGELADRLSGNNNAASLARIAGKQRKPETAYGFSSVVPLKKTAFRIGVCLTALEVALKAKDKEKIDAFSKRLIELLKPIAPAYGPIPAIIEQKGNGNSGREASRYEDFSSAVEGSFENTQVAVFLKFGEWVEAAGLAAEVRNAAFFQPVVVSGFRQELETSGAPVGTTKNLSHLESIIASGKVETEEFTTMVQLLADIKEMF